MKKALNLNPKSIEENNKDRESFVLIILYLLITLILCLNVFAIWLDNNSLNAEKSMLKTQISNLKTEAGNYTKLEKEINSKENFISNAEKLENNKNYKKYISGIGKYMPKNIYITSAVYNDALITLNGVAKNGDEVAEFLANLQMSNDYSNAQLLNMNKVEENEVVSYTDLYTNKNELKKENDKNNSKQDLKNKNKVNVNTKEHKLDGNNNKALNKNIVKQNLNVPNIQFTINIKE